MTISYISHYRGGTIEDVLPLSRALKAIYQTYGVAYRLSQVQTGPNTGDWCVIVTYADPTAQETAEALFARDQNLQNIFTAIATFAKRVSRDRMIDLDL